MCSIAWDDTTTRASAGEAAGGAQTLAPSSGTLGRFNGWTPAWADDLLFVEHSMAFAAHAFEIDVRPKVAFDFPNLADAAKAQRLVKHLLRGGDCDLTLHDRDSHVYTGCVLAPGTRPQLSPPDRETYEYTLSLVLISLDTDDPLVASY